MSKDEFFLFLTNTSFNFQISSDFCGLCIDDKTRDIFMNLITLIVFHTSISHLGPVLIQQITTMMNSKAKTNAIKNHLKIRTLIRIWKNILQYGRLKWHDILIKRAKIYAFSFHRFLYFLNIVTAILFRC